MVLSITYNVRQDNPPRALLLPSWRTRLDLEAEPMYVFEPALLLRESNPKTAHRHRNYCCGRCPSSDTLIFGVSQPAVLLSLPVVCDWVRN